MGALDLEDDGDAGGDAAVWLSELAPTPPERPTLVAPTPRAAAPTPEAAAPAAAPAPSERPTLPPTRTPGLPPVLGDFEPFERLGQGGMGTVYRARQLSLQRDVALKVLAPHVAAASDAAERFLREARAGAAVSHPNVIACYQVGEAEGLLYMALELATGGDVEQLARAGGGKLPERRALELIRDACRGLVAIERAGLVHRDVKPSNIFVGADGEGKLADLGLARSVLGDDRMTQTGLVVGTPAFMAPEQAEGAVAIDVRADVYGLGATLFTLVTGRAPFEGTSPLVVVSKVLNAPSPDPLDFEARLSVETAAVIRKAMAKDRADRYPSAEALLRDLEAALRALAGGGHELGPSASSARLRAPTTHTRVAAPARLPSPHPAAGPRGHQRGGGPLGWVAAAAAVGVGVLAWQRLGDPAPAPPAVASSTGAGAPRGPSGPTAPEAAPSPAGAQAPLDDTRALLDALLPPAPGEAAPGEPAPGEPAGAAPRTPHPAPRPAPASPPRPEQPPAAEPAPLAPLPAPARMGGLVELRATARGQRGGAPRPGGAPPSLEGGRWKVAPAAGRAWVLDAPTAESAPLRVTWLLDGLEGGAAGAAGAGGLEMHLAASGQPEAIDELLTGSPRGAVVVTVRSWGRAATRVILWVPVDDRGLVLGQLELAPGLGPGEQLQVGLDLTGQGWQLTLDRSRGRDPDPVGGPWPVDLAAAPRALVAPVFLRAAAVAEGDAQVAVGARLERARPIAALAPKPAAEPRAPEGPTEPGPPPPGPQPGHRPPRRPPPR